MEVRIILQERADALLVPEGALIRRRGSWFVFRVEEGRARRVNVKIGLSDGKVREVLDGLREEDQVVLFPDERVRDGVRLDRVAAAE